MALGTTKGMKCIRKHRSGPKAGKCAKFGKKRGGTSRKRRGSTKGRKCTRKYRSGPKAGKCAKFS